LLQCVFYILVIMMTNSNDPLHGVKLEQILVELEKKLGWKAMGELLNINCFINHPRLKSSLKFLRKTPWARNKVEILYLKTFFRDHPATKRLIKAIIVNKRASSDNSSETSGAFIWPTLKDKTKK